MAVNALYLDNWTVEKVERSKEGYRFDAIRAKAINIRPVEAKGLFVCESCLGQFDSRWRHIYEPEPRPGYPRLQRLCATCFRLHTPEWFIVPPRSTPKSG